MMGDRDPFLQMLKHEVRWTPLRNLVVDIDEFAGVLVRMSRRPPAASGSLSA